MAKLIDYLNKIAAGQAVNYPLLLKLLPAQWQVDHHLLFKPQKI